MDYLIYNDIGENDDDIQINISKCHNDLTLEKKEVSYSKIDSKKT